MMNYWIKSLISSIVWLIGIGVAIYGAFTISTGVGLIALGVAIAHMSNNYSKTLFRGRRM